MDNYITLEFDKIKAALEALCVNEYAKNKARKLAPMLNEAELRRELKDTAAARKIINCVGSPPISGSDDIKILLEIADKEGILYPEQLEKMRYFASASKRLKAYLKKAEVTEQALAYIGTQLDGLDEISDEIDRCIANGDVDYNATPELSRLHRKREEAEAEIKVQLDNILRKKREYMADSFVSIREGRHTLPVKKEHKAKIPGRVVAVSAAGGTCFIEPEAVVRLNETAAALANEEELEKTRILYGLTALISGYTTEIKLNVETMERLDYSFSKGRLSADMDGVTPQINTDRRMKIEKGRHPMLKKEECVPLDFKLGESYNGIIITGPNTGGKTVALKLIGLFSLMAQSGLQLPCQSADICMNSRVLCDIGDGQSITQNLSTFSAHITNVISILGQADSESLVLLDELGSGTDPEEGMGLAIAILEELRQCGCLFVATTHYSEVKVYTAQAAGLTNARMTFDEETLNPLYKLVIGEAGESCAFHVAKRLGLEQRILDFARKQLEGRKGGEYSFQPSDISAKSVKAPSVIQKAPKERRQPDHVRAFKKGDSVLVLPEKDIGIIYEPADETGMLTVQVKGKKQKVNHKRIQLQIEAEKLYPPDYDFSIIFDSVENRKAAHQMTKRHNPDLEIKYEG